MGTTDKAADRLQVWLDRLQAGDESAKSELINHSCKRLQRLASRMMRRYRKLQRWEEADDVFQDAMLRLHRSLSEVQPESVRQFFALAATQIRRTLIDLARRHFGPEGPGTYEHVGLDGVPTTNSDEPSDPRQWAEFYDALDILPQGERDVVDFLWFEGLTQAEAAFALGVNSRTIRRWWYSARYRLHKALRHES
jgi:RNA polymerase sigma-70 factor (ECF subfamily)